MYIATKTRNINVQLMLITVILVHKSCCDCCTLRIKTRIHSNTKGPDCESQNPNSLLIVLLEVSEFVLGLYNIIAHDSIIHLNFPMYGICM